MTDEVILLKKHAVEKMQTQPASERLAVLSRLLEAARRETRSAVYDQIIFLHGELLRIHNGLVAIEKMKEALSFQREAERVAWQKQHDTKWAEATKPIPMPPPPPRYTAQSFDTTYTDTKFQREQQRGMLAFGMIVGGTGALVAALFVAPVPTAVVIGTVLIGRYIMEPKPDRDAPKPGGGNHYHYHYHQNNYQNNHERQG